MLYVKNVPAWERTVRVVAGLVMIACGLFGLVLKPVSEAAVAAFVDGLRLFGIGYSWGGFESLIVPAHIRRTAKPFVAGHWRTSLAP